MLTEKFSSLNTTHSGKFLNFFCQNSITFYFGDFLMKVISVAFGMAMFGIWAAGDAGISSV
jgi:hypothetical protein